MRFAFVLALVALTAGAERPERYGGRDMRSGGRGGVGTTPTYLEFAPASGAGLPSWPTFCSSVNSSLSGGWCANADTTATGATLTLGGDAVVTPTTLCPNGPDCSPVNVLKFTTTGFAGTTAYTLSTAFTACWYGVVGSGQTNYNVMLAHALSGSTTEMTFSVEWSNTTGTFDFYVRNSTCSSATWRPGVPQLVCAVHAGGTATPALYVDGALACTGNISVDAPDVSAPDTIGGRNGVESFGDDLTTLGAFVAQADIRTSLPAIYAAIVPTAPNAIVNGNTRVPMTYSRTGSRFCLKADNTGSILPSNRPCISQSGYLSEGAATNLLLRSQEFDNASWVKNASVSVTANYGLAPDGTKTAERFVSHVGSFDFIYQSFAGTAGTTTFSVFAKGTSGAGNLTVCLFVASIPIYQCEPCAYTSDAVTRCSITRTTTTDWRPLIGNALSVAAGSDVLLWGAQVETGPVATSYIPTTSAAASRGADLGYFVDPNLTLTPSRFSASLTASITSAPGQYASFLRLAGPSYQTDTVGRGVWLYSNSTLGTTFRVYSANNSGAAAAITGSIAPPTSPFRVIAYNDGSTLNFSMGATTATPGAFTPGAFENIKYIDIGNQQGAATLDALGGRISKVCLDPRPSRCR